MRERTVSISKAQANFHSFGRSARKLVTLGGSPGIALAALSLTNFLTEAQDAASDLISNDFSDAADIDHEDSREAATVLLQTLLTHPSRRLSSLGQKSEVPGPGSSPDGLKDVFVQLFEWSWDDVAQECEDFLGPVGYKAVLVSPPNEHIVGDAWHDRYQPVTYNLTSRSGNEEQFASMIQRCRQAGVGVYADAVFNHCAAMGGEGVAGTKFGYRTYPMYDPPDFHHFPWTDAENCGVINYQDAYNVQYCDLQGMPDLCTGCEKVQKVVAAYIEHMVSLGIAGIRVDAAKHMEPNELNQLLSRVSPNIYKFLEVLVGPGEAVQTPAYSEYHPVTEFGFAATIAPKFTGEGLLRDDLAKFGEGWGLTASPNAVVFLDNHDSQRSSTAPLTYKSGVLYDLVSVFMLAYPYGYPKVMSSYYFENATAGPPPEGVHGKDGAVNCGPGKDWVCEHRRSAMANMVGFRKAAGDSQLRNFKSDGDTMVFCRGTAACVAFNLGNSTWVTTLSLSLPPGRYCNVLAHDPLADKKDCPTIFVNADGEATVVVPSKGAIAIHIDALAGGRKALPKRENP